MMQVTNGAMSNRVRSLPLPARCEALLDGLLEDVVLLRVHPYREEAVSHLGGGSHTRRGDGGGVDRNVFLAVQNALQRLAEAGGARAGVRQLVHLALEGHRPLAGDDLLHDGDVLLQPGHRLAVGHAVPAFHHLRAGGAEAADEAPAGQLRQAHGGHGGHGRGAGRHLHDGGAGLDLGGLGEDPCAGVTASEP
jgi:hypothetical protein